MSFITLLPLAVAVAATASWKAVDPSLIRDGTQSDYFENDLRRGWRQDRPSNIYWVRVRRTNDRYEIAEVAPAPIMRWGTSEEILVIDTESHEVHPAFDVIDSEPAARRRIDCGKSDIAAVTPYTACNSRFASPPSATARLVIGILSGGKSEANLAQVKGELRIYEAQSLTPMVANQDFNLGVLDRLAAAAETRRQAIVAMEADKQAIKQANEERARIATGAESAQRNTLVQQLKRLGIGFKDVCEYAKQALEAGLYSTTDNLRCINLGDVPDLNALKEAGFIVTNLQERRPGDRYSAIINVEKFE